MKKACKPGTVLFPLPVVLITCVAGGYRPNIIPMAWVGIVCADPPLVSIAMKPSRHSYALIAASGEFVINVPGEHHLASLDWCGTVSGRTCDKFAAAGFTPCRSAVVKAPGIAECPVNIECTLMDILKPGREHILIGKVVHMQVEDALLDSTGRIDLAGIRPVTLNGDEYWGLGAKKLAQYGFSRGKSPDL